MGYEIVSRAGRQHACRLPAVKRWYAKSFDVGDIIACKVCDRQWVAIQLIGVMSGHYGWRPLTSV